MAETATMRVKEIRIFPIKSMRGVSLQSHRASAMGFEYDRIFMLQRVEDDKNMHIKGFPSMCLFTTELLPNNGNPDKVLVRFGLDHAFDQPENKLPDSEKVLEIPLQPEVEGLKETKCEMWNAATQAYIMPDTMGKWFSNRFGYRVRLLYIGLNKREVLGNLNPNAPRTYVGDPDPMKEAQKVASPNGGWLGGLKSGVGSLIGNVTNYSNPDTFRGVENGITFADLAAFLVLNDKSCVDAISRTGATFDVNDKFRPNIVIDGAEDAWVEDYWGEISIGPVEQGNRLVFTSNCARCASVNVDYSTGKPAEGPEGKLLALLQKDRRVDPGIKYSPVNGRYGFLSQRNGVKPEKLITINVGDEVSVTKRNDRRTHLYYPGISS